jgi:serpin B
MKRLISCFLAISMLLFLVSCNKSENSSDIIDSATLLAEPANQLGPIDSNLVRKDSVSSINQFSYKSAAQVLNDIKTNGCYSPISLYFALALAANGANGKTSDELLMLLGSEDKAKSKKSHVNS